MMSRTAVIPVVAFLLLASCATPGPDSLFLQTASQHGDRAVVLRNVPDFLRGEGIPDGAAALADVANYWGRPLLLQTAAAAFQKARTTAAAEEALITVAEANGLWSMSMYGSQSLLLDRIRHGVPVIVILQDWTNIDSRRFTVVVGFDDVAHEFLCHDGTGAPVVYGFDEFARKWMPVRNWMAVLCSPTGARWALSSDELVSRASFHERHDRWDEALADYQAAAKLVPDRVDIQMGLARAYQGRGLYEDAAKLYRTLLQKYPQNLRIANNLAFVLARSQSSLGEAEGLARSAVQAEPTNPAALDTLGYVLLARKQFAEAIPVLERAYELSQGLDAHAQHEIAVHLALAYLGDRRVQMMQKIISDILESEPDFQLPKELKATPAKP